MKTFKEYILEMANPDGNYVCADVLSMDGAIRCFEEEGIDLSVGDPPPNNDYHITLMYSKESSVDTDRILKHVYESFPPPYDVEFAAAACFDSTPKDGSRDATKSCVVLKIKSKTLDKIHDTLKSFGLVHSYAEFSPHITLLYNLDVDKAHAIRDQINACVARMEFSILGYKSQQINKNYV